jgi:hypothetical protein
MVILSTPRVRHVRNHSTADRLPSSLQRKWERRAHYNYQEVYEIYMKMAENCVWWRHVVRRSPDKKKRQHARKCFLRDYPVMMAMTQIGMDDHLPWGTCQKLDLFYYRLNTR